MNTTRDEARGDESPRGFRFGDCELDLRRRELRRGGIRVDIQPRAFDCLAFLVAQRDRTVSKDELQAAVWGSQIVSDAALTQSVTRARKAIAVDGDDADRWIRTVHARGYRFIGDVTPVGATVDNLAPPRAEIDQPLHGDPAVPIAELPTNATPATLHTAPDAADAATVEAPPDGGEPPDGASSPVLAKARLLQRGALAAAVVVICIAGLFAWRQHNRPIASDAPVRIAVLPFDNATGDPRLDWVELGLMSQVTRQLEYGLGLSVVPERDMLTLDQLPAAGAAPAERLERVQRATGATHLLDAHIETKAGRMQLRYTLMSADHARRRSLVAGDPEHLARSLVSDLNAQFGQRGLRVSDVAEFGDDFVSETYLRGLSLQLAGDAPGAEALFAVAVEAAPQAFWPRYEHALSLRALGRHEESAATLHELLNHPATEDARARLAVLNSLGATLIAEQSYDEAQAVLQQALAASHDAQDPEATSAVLTNLGLVDKNLGRLDSADAWLAAAIEAWGQTGIPQIPGSILNTRAQVALRRGDLVEAERLLGEAVAALRLVGNRRYEASALSVLGGVHARQGQWAQAVEIHGLAYDIRRDLGNPALAAWSLIQLAEAHAETGRASLARREALDARALADTVADDDVIGRAAALLVRLDVPSGDETVLVPTAVAAE